MKKHSSFLWFVVIHAAIGFLAKKIIDRKNANHEWER